MPPPPRTAITQPFAAAARLAATSGKPPAPPPAAKASGAEARVPAITMTSASSDATKSSRGSALGKKGRRTTGEEPKPTMLSPMSASEVAPPKAPDVTVVAAPPSAAATTAPAADGGLRAAATTPDAPITRSPSTAPEAPLRMRSTPPSLDDETARLLEDLDAGFDSIVRPTVRLTPSPRVAALPREELASSPEITIAALTPAASPEALAARHEADMAEVRELFAGIAVAYARPLRDFMIEIAWGQPTHEWIEVALPATHALRAAAAAVELPGVDKALEGYQTALDLALGESVFSQEVREMIASAYGRLIEALPNVFALEGELVRREPIIVRSLLLQVPGVRYVAIEKLYRAGINALEVFYAARPRDLAEATGIDDALAVAICARFQKYRQEIADLGPAQERAKERAELTGLVAELVAQHEEHEKAAKEWTPDAAARRATARKDRAETTVRIDLLLARMGEIDLQRAIAKLPFQQKIRSLYRFLEEANQRAGR
jgi:hypothetical protein